MPNKIWYKVVGCDIFWLILGIVLALLKKKHILLIGLRTFNTNLKFSEICFIYGLNVWLQ